jgi:hypothetical protein
MNGRENAGFTGIMVCSLVVLAYEILQYSLLFFPSSTIGM